MKLTHLKKKCMGCGNVGVPMSKEHIFPKWLILRTNTQKTGIRWGKRRNIPALAVTLPLCKKCNRDFGEYLEKPVSKIFDDIEQGRGISDNDAELLIRWLWKIKGISWMALHPNQDYTKGYLLRERILYPIDNIRKHLVLAISLIKDAEEGFSDLPMGVDSITEIDAIFVSGVFSRIAIMSVLEPYESDIPENFDKYKLAEKSDKFGDMKIFFPREGFDKGSEAVFITVNASLALSKMHDEFAAEIIKRHQE